MSEATRRLLVAYDVAQDARRDRVARLLLEFGERVQYSVFIVDGRPADFVRLRSALAATIVADEDRVLLCDVGARDAAANGAISYLGRKPRLMGDARTLIV